jgi:hypothetical protein
MFRGTADSMANFAVMLTGVDRKRGLFNFTEATSLALHAISVRGPILAPLSDINSSGGNINGNLIGKNIYGPGEAHLYLLQGDVPLAAPPEPGTLVGAVAGLLAAAWRLRPSKRATKVA